MILTRTNAVGGTGLVTFVWLTDWRPGVLIAVVDTSALMGAWLGAWAWRRERWGTASVMLIASLAIPWGYFRAIAGPVVLGLSTVAAVRGWRARRIEPRPD